MNMLSDIEVKIIFNSSGCIRDLNQSTVMLQRNRENDNYNQLITCKLAFCRWNFLANLEKSGTLRSSSCRNIYVQ